MSHFNEQAATWDSPEKVKMMDALAQRTLAALRAEGLCTDHLDIVDFGCGTGLFGLAFADGARSLTGIDTSPGMLDGFQRKIDGRSHIRAVCADLEQKDTDIRADLIVSSMAFHHLADPSTVVAKMKKMLRPDGAIAIVDLDAEDGTFHPDNQRAGVRHYGFSGDTVASWATDNGLSLHRDIIYEIEKNGRAYPVFLAILRPSPAPVDPGAM